MTINSKLNHAAVFSNRIGTSKFITDVDKPLLGFRSSEAENVRNFMKSGAQKIIFSGSWF